MLSLIVLVNRLRQDQELIKMQLIDNGPVDSETYKILVARWHHHKEMLDLITSEENEDD